MRLNGIRVLDLTRLLPGPYGTQLLADAGADVIKVEDTEAGDYARNTPPQTDREVGALFDVINRGKRSVALDLKTDAGRDVFYRLVADADVVFEQFRPGVTERLGIDYETVHEYNEDVIYCSLSGYGQTGPYSDRVGHDLNYVGVAGLLDMTREDTDMDPQIPGYPIGDMAGGLFAVFSIVGALCSRELGNTGGEYIDIAMTDVVASFSQSVAFSALTGDPPRPGETSLTGAFPWYDIYETADNRYVTLAALEPKFWTAFCEAIGRKELIDEHMTTDPAARKALREELEEIFTTKTRAEWETKLDDIEAMVGPVNTPAEALEHPQLRARGLIETPDNAPPRVGFPARSSEPSGAPTETVPAHGEHTETVLRNHGLDDEIERLRAADVIA